jgi:WD40 repeat protein
VIGDVTDDRTDDQIITLTYSPDGSTLAAGLTSELILVDAATGDVRWRTEDAPRSTWRIAFSSDGSTMASGEYAGRVSTWSLRGPKPVLQEDLLLDANIVALSISPDSRWLVAGDCFGKLFTAKLHDVATSFDLPGHAGKINQVAFSPDGNTMASGDDDGIIKFWRVGSWRNTGELVFDEPVQSVGFVSKSNGDRALVVGTGEGSKLQVSLLKIRSPSDWSWPQIIAQDER